MSRPRSDLPPVTETGPLTYEPSPRWVRGLSSETTVVDSKQPLLLWERGNVLPLYLFPKEDVDQSLMEPSSDPPSQSAHHGLVSYFDMKAAEDLYRNAAWRYDVPDLDGYLAFDWAAMDTWLEEDEEILAHPRDPYHRVDNRRSSRHVLVRVDDQVLADSKTPTLVFETGLPTRYYLPRKDVSMEYLEPSSMRTLCAYKKEASYWSVRVGDELIEDLVWMYEAPLADSSRLAGLLCFFNEKCDIEVDGVSLDRPETAWSAGLRSNVTGGGSGREQTIHT